MVLRDVPTSPTFVVIPSSFYYHQVAFANDVEGAILAAGAAVLDRSGRDTHVAVETTTGTEEGATQSRVTRADEARWIAAAGAEARQIESYTRFLLDVETDYGAVTYATERRIRIIRRSTLEVVASFRVPSSGALGLSQNAFDDAVADVLEALGLSVRRGERPRPSGQR